MQKLRGAVVTAAAVGSLALVAAPAQAGVGGSGQGGNFFGPGTGTGGGFEQSVGNGAWENGWWYVFDEGTSRPGHCPDLG